MRPSLEPKTTGGANSLDETHDLENALNGLGPAHKGKPVEEIKPVVRSTWHNIADGDLDDERVDAFAEAVSVGTPIRIEYGGIK